MLRRTSLIKVNSKNPERHEIELAADIILKGGLVAFPTETVYGLGANGFDLASVNQIFSVKNRPKNNPLIMHISSIKDLDLVAEDVTDNVLRVAKKFWPGPLSLVLKKSKVVPYLVTGGLDTVAVRIPNNQVSLSLIKTAGVPIAAPSANLSGRPSPTTASHVMDDLYGKVELILDGGRCDIGLESSVVDMTSCVPVLLRAGGLPYEKIRKTVSNLVIHPSVINPENVSSHDGSVSRSPGMRYRHYSPNADVILIEGPREKVRRKIDKLSREIKNLEGKKVCIISRSHNRKYIADRIECVGSDFATSGRNLFDIFRSADSSGIDVIIAEGMEYTDLGLALMNRLKKAATRVINLSQETFD